MDVYCPKCGEPWDTYTFHEVAEEIGSTYTKVTADFRQRGCAAIESWGAKCNPETVGTMRSEAAGVLYELLGDDMDGAASMLEDFEYMGMLD